MTRPLMLLSLLPLAAFSQVGDAYNARSPTPVIIVVVQEAQPSSNPTSTIRVDLWAFIAQPTPATSVPRASIFNTPAPIARSLELVGGDVEFYPPSPLSRQYNPSDIIGGRNLGSPIGGDYYPPAPISRIGSRASALGSGEPVRLQNERPPLVCSIYGTCEEPQYTVDQNNSPAILPGLTPQQRMAVFGWLETQKPTQPTIASPAPQPMSILPGPAALHNQHMVPPVHRGAPHIR